MCVFFNTNEKTQRCFSNQNWVVVSNIFYFHSDPWGNLSHFDHIIFFINVLVETTNQKNAPQGFHGENNRKNQQLSPWMKHPWLVAVLRSL